MRKSWVAATVVPYWYRCRDAGAISRASELRASKDCVVLSAEAKRACSKTRFHEKKVAQAEDLLWDVCLRKKRKEGPVCF
jgi:hypothetical protein